MKKFFILLILSSSAVCASEGIFLFDGQPSLLAGVNSISSNVGYSIQIGSPKFIRDFISVQCQWIGMSNYNIFELGVLYTFYLNEYFKLGFKTMLGFSFSKENSFGGHYSFNGEIRVVKNLWITFEPGFSTVTYNLGNNNYGAGFSFLAGPKLYLF